MASNQPGGAQQWSSWSDNWWNTWAATGQAWPQTSQSGQQWPSNQQQQGVAWSGIQDSRSLRAMSPAKAKAEAAEANAEVANAKAEPAKANAEVAKAKAELAKANAEVAKGKFPPVRWPSPPRPARAKGPLPPWMQPQAMPPPPKAVQAQVPVQQTLQSKASSSWDPLVPSEPVWSQTAGTSQSPQLNLWEVAGTSLSPPINAWEQKIPEDYMVFQI